MVTGLQHVESREVDRAAHEWWRFRVSPLVVVLAAILFVLIVPPTLYLINTSFHTTKLDGSFDEFTQRYYQQLFTSRYFAASLLNTVVYAIGSSIIALSLRIVQALIVERANTPGRNYVFLGAVISLAIPHALSVWALLFFLGRNRPVHR